VRVVAGTVFARAGEVEEALEALGAGAAEPVEDLEATAVLVQVYLSIRRPDLARREYTRANKWAEDDLLLQHIEASIGLVTGKDGYGNPHSYFAEQLNNPTLEAPHLRTARGTTYLLRGAVPEAAADFAEAAKDPVELDAVANAVAAAALQGKWAESEELVARLQALHPGHTLVVDLAKKSEMFDEIAINFTVPPPAVEVS